MQRKYSYQGFGENMAKAAGRDLPISLKVSIEIANHLRGKTTDKAKKILNRVLEYKQPIPFKRFTDGVGHKKGISGAGRFPQKASKEFLKLIEQAEANAQTKGLASDLIIVHLAAQKSTAQYRYGRMRRRMFKRTHVELVVEEYEGKKAEKKEVVKETEKKPAPEKKEAPVKEEKKPVKEEKKEELVKEEKPEAKKEPVKKAVKKKTAKKSQSKNVPEKKGEEEQK